MYVNLWYVAASSDDVTFACHKVRMLGRDFVLYRDKEGRAHCLSNVCPHRGSSLAQGRITDDGTLQCPQHGWRFGHDGRCVRIPARGETDPIPEAAKVDSYPVVERHGLIWTFFGERPGKSPPIPDLSECEAPGWRTLKHVEVWNANYHWAKLSNIDRTHVPFVHGQNFQGPFPPQETITRLDDYSFASSILTPFEQPKGAWSDVREPAKNVASTLSFFASGLTLKGSLEIGGEGSGVFMTFIEMSTPIDAESTAMYYLFARNFMTDPAMDEDVLRRNLKNVREDRAIAEQQMPKRGPSRTRGRDFLVDPDDSLLRRYWEILDRLHERGDHIDTDRLDAFDRGRVYAAIPSPARAASPRSWVHEAVPRH